MPPFPGFAGDIIMVFATIILPLRGLWLLIFNLLLSRHLAITSSCLIFVPSDCRAALPRGVVRGRSTVTVFAYPGLRNAHEFYRCVGFVPGIAYPGLFRLNPFGILTPR